LVESWVQGQRPAAATATTGMASAAVTPKEDRRQRKRYLRLLAWGRFQNL
jgi:hypothetical protein